MLTDALCTSGLAATQSLSTQMNCSSHPTLQLMLAVVNSFRQLACMKTVAYGGKSKTLAGSSTANLQTGMLMHTMYCIMLLMCCVLGNTDWSMVIPYMLALRVPRHLAVMSLRALNRGRSAKVLHQGLLLLQLFEHYQLPKYAGAGASCQSTAHLDWSTGAARCQWWSCYLLVYIVVHIRQVKSALKLLRGCNFA